MVLIYSVEMGLSSPYISFRPLAGIMVLIDVIGQRGFVDDIVSVPLRGLWFLSSAEKIVKTINPACFRPLAGIMVLISVP